MSQWVDVDGFIGIGKTMSECPVLLANWKTTRRTKEIRRVSIFITTTVELISKYPW